MVLSLKAIHDTIVPGEPETNPAERQARELREQLELLARDTWVPDSKKANFVQSAELAHNTTVSPSRGASPYAMLHGSPRSLKQPQLLDRVMAMCRNRSLLKSTNNQMSTKKMGFLFGLYLGPDEPNNQRIARIVMTNENENVFASCLVSNMEKLP